MKNVKEYMAHILNYACFHCLDILTSNGYEREIGATEEKEIWV